MTTAAAIQVHPRPKPVGDVLLFGEVLQSKLEERVLFGTQAGDWPAGGSGSGADPGVPGSGRAIHR